MKYIFVVVLVCYLCGCSPTCTDLEVDFYLLGANKDELVITKGVPDKTYTSDGVDVFEYINSVATSSYETSTPNYTYNFGNSSLSSINSFGGSSSKRVMSRFILKNNKVVSFVNPYGSGQIN